VVGNHTKKVCAMAWSGADVLAYGTHEDTLSLCSRDGDLLNVISLRGRPTDLNFGLIKVENESVSSNQHNAVYNKPIQSKYDSYNIQYEY